MQTKIKQKEREEKRNQNQHALRAQGESRHEVTYINMGVDHGRYHGPCHRRRFVHGLYHDTVHGPVLCAMQHAMVFG